MTGINILRLIGTLLLYPLRKKRHAQDEWFDIVTLSGKKLAKAPRSICHKGPGLLHKVVHLHVSDSQGRLYLQKRSLSKKIQPGKWDTSVGGHVDAGETVEKALIREAREELGIEGFTPHYLETYLWESEQESELVHSFTASWQGKILIDPQEIDEARFWTKEEIDKALGTGQLTPNFEQEYRRLRDEL